MPISLRNSFLTKVATHWDRLQAGKEDGIGGQWFEISAVMNRMAEKVSGRQNVDPYQYLIEVIQRRGGTLPLERCLTLGCGAGALERGLAKYNFCKIHEGLDVAAQTIQKARQLAAEAGLHHIEYTIADVDTMQLPVAVYDVVLATMSVHHFFQLEHVFSQVRRALKPGGLFFLNEYIGPDRLGQTPRQQEIANSLLKILPRRYRQLRDGSVKEWIISPEADKVRALDPSEAVRSSEIIPVLLQYFVLVERKDYGGTILAPLLNDLARNFDVEREEDNQILKMLFQVEDALLAAGEITSDFTVIIAEPKA